jgi:hypothetical protein
MAMSYAGSATSAYAKTKGFAHTAGSRSGTSAEEERSRQARESTQRGTSTTARDQQTATQQRTTGRQTSETSLESVLASLDETSRVQLTELLGAASQADNLGDLLGSLSERALSAGGELGESRQAIVDVARQRGERKIGQTQQALSGIAGSSQNTLVQQLGLEGSVQLETELAALNAQLVRDDRAQIAGELQGATQALVGSTTGIADILKGALTQQQQTEIGVTESQQIQNIMSNLAETGVQVDESTISDILQQVRTGTKTIDEIFAEHTDETVRNKSHAIAFAMGQ